MKTRSEFLKRASDYGVKPILTSWDFILAVTSAILYLALKTRGIQIARESLVAQGFTFFTALIAFILTGLALVVSFSDKKFLALLKEKKIYNNLMFLFEFVIYLTALTAITSAIILSYNLVEQLFVIYLFLAVYTTTALLSLVGTIVSYGERKAKFELIEQASEDS